MGSRGGGLGRCGESQSLLIVMPVRPAEEVMESKAGHQEERPGQRHSFEATDVWGLMSCGA